METNERTSLTVDLLRPLYWVAATAAYWFSALRLLRSISPIYSDGYGRMPSFYWGTEPRTESGITLPYWIGATIVTALGLAATFYIVQFLRPRVSRLFVAAAAAAAGILLFGAAISDSGGYLNLWRGPRMLGELHSFFVLLTLIIPMSLFSGLSS